MIRSLPAEMARRIAAFAQRLALAPHRPEEVKPGEVWCLRDQVPWPCDEWVRLTGEAA